MHTLRSTVFAALLCSAAAKKCMNATVPVNVSARTGVFGKIPVPQTSIDATDFIANLAKQGSNYTELGLTGYNTIAGTYQISTQFCTPDDTSAKNPTVQVLTHGIGFDKTYWDLSYNNYNYSYVNAATNAGYCTLSFDRLGIGMSSHGEPLNEIQGALEVEALHQLTLMLRGGTFPGVKQAFTKIVHVGHSFGSGQTYNLVNMYPDVSDGIILTGFSANNSFTADFLAGGNFVQASQNQPLRFGNIDPMQVQSILAGTPLADYIAGLDLSALPKGQNLPNGYLISSNAEANKLLFFLPGAFDPMILTLAENTKQPVTLGELLTLGSVPMMNQFAGPVMVLTGSNDVPFCGGDCLATGMPDLASIPAGVMKAFASVSPDNFTAYIQPNTAHGINLHYNSTGAYSVIQNFLASKGLATS